MQINAPIPDIHVENVLRGTLTESMLTPICVTLSTLACAVYTRNLPAGFDLSKAAYLRSMNITKHRNGKHGQIHAHLIVGGGPEKEMFGTLVQDYVFEINGTSIKIMPPNEA